VFKYRDVSRTAPFEAGTFNHRAEAFYRALEESPESDMVQQVLQKGLVKVKMMILDYLTTNNYQG
jgi:hypothetical protein